MVQPWSGHGAAMLPSRARATRHNPCEWVLSAPILPCMATIKGGILGEGSGRLAGAVMVRTAAGKVYLREHVIPRNPNTEKQRAWRALRAQAMRAYRTLSPEQVQNWARYGRERAIDGHPWRAVDAFMALSSKFLQVDADRVIPLDPPEALFVGDAVVVVAEAGAGSVEFRALAANHAGVVTELLLAPMRTAGTNPNDRAFRHQRFVAFTGPGTESVPVDRPGWWAAAVRFVRVDTGQMSGLLRVGIVRVQ